LSVQAVLNGRVTQRNDQLTLSLELVDARTGDQIWGEQYNRKTADVSPDGRRFLIGTLIGESKAAAPIVILNWTAELKK